MTQKLNWTPESNNGINFLVADACDGLAYIIVGDYPQCTAYRRSGTAHRLIGFLASGHFVGPLDECKSRCESDVEALTCTSCQCLPCACHDINDRTDRP